MSRHDESRQPAPAGLSPERRRVIAAGGGAAALAGLSQGTVAGLLLQGTGSAHAQAGGDLPIGIIKPMTGPLASSFVPLYMAADIAIDEINAAGGILGRKLVKVEVDDEGSPAKQPAAMRSLVEKGIRIVVGPTGSSQAIASLEVATPAKVIQGSYATAEEVGDGTRFPYHYQFVFHVGGQAKRYLDGFEKMGIKELGMLSEDSAAGDSAKTSVNKMAPGRGFKLLSQQVFPIKTTDMTPFLRKLRADGTKGLIAYVSNNNDLTQFLVGLSRLGWKPPIIGHTGLLFLGMPGAVPDSVRYPDIYACTFRDLTYTDTEKIPAKVQAYCDKVMKANVPEAMLGPAATSPFYDFLWTVKRAAERAKSLDSEALKKAMDAFDGDGLYGKLHLSASRHSAYDSDVVSLAMVNSVEEPTSKASRGLYRRRGPV